MGEGYIVRRGGSMGNKSVVIVTGPTGSTVTLEKNGKVKNTLEKNGTWTFRNIENGTWMLKASKDNASTNFPVEITKFQVYYVSFTYRLLPGSILWPMGSVKGRDYEVYKDDGSIIPPEQYSNTINWRIKIFNSINIEFKQPGAIDLFLVGGGGGSGTHEQGDAFGGGGGGYTTTRKGIGVRPQEYKIAVGAGGSPGSRGGTTSAFGNQATGGFPGIGYNSSQKPDHITGGAGGSGGGGYVRGTGGSDGSDGTNSGGKGQGTTTREFGEFDKTLYAGGGSGGGYKDWGSGGHGAGGAGGGGTDGPGAANTGGGGGAGDASVHPDGSYGGSGVVVIRNAR